MHLEKEIPRDNGVTPSQKKKQISYMNNMFRNNHNKKYLNYFIFIPFRFRLT